MHTNTFCLVKCKGEFLPRGKKARAVYASSSMRYENDMRTSTYTCGVRDYLCAEEDRRITVTLKLCSIVHHEVDINIDNDVQKIASSVIRFIFFLKCIVNFL
ncbi:hypothetical protein POVWA2_075640 [Plasmodium ovale wallikeri]|uniref:Uncharacterized protein n=1 Tax=Plasmodium ovale wallikeri TaxID=864142 RepID=A0A1A9AKY1_PLAOA|nr:hypothetical protein POVWA1_012650 [Plasmodium ovale wallikeri]SBT56848.1 hypothetical protein POVWA2_075640 [Plasmodium ovale wallikeri]